MHKLVLLRHGQSQWNLENRFTGWTDVDLTAQGIEEANKAGKLLKAEGYHFDVAYTSVLKRAIRTLWIVMDNMDLMWIPVYRSWRLNERHYGALQGLNKQETATKYGDKQVKIWRRSYNTLPPALEKGDDRLLDNESTLQPCFFKRSAADRGPESYGEEVSTLLEGNNCAVLAIREKGSYLRSR